MEKTESHYVTDIATIAREGVAGHNIKIASPTGETIEVIAVPHAGGGVDLKSVKPFIDEWRTAPERRKGTARMLTLASLAEFANRHKDGGSVLFAILDEKAASLTAVFDYHQIDHSPRFGQHRAVYSFPISEEWAAWKKMNAEVMTQGDWAAFIEERIADLSPPLDQEVTDYEALFRTKIAVPSDMITLSRGLKVSIEAKIGEARTLQSGEAELSFEEVHKDGSGQWLIIPGLFVIRIPIFVDAEPTRFLARLRYRVAGAKIVWFYQLYRADLVVREAMRNDAEMVARDTGLPLFEGSPEAS